MKVFLNESVTIDGKHYAGGFIYEVDEDTAKKMFELAGTNAIGMDVPEVEQYADEVEKHVAEAEFKREVEKIENSIDPRYKDEEFKQAAIDELKTELDENVREVQARYEQFLESLRQAAAEEAASAKIILSDDRRKQAALKVDRLISEATFGSLDDALTELENNVDYMSKFEKEALSLELHRLAAVVDEVDKKRVKRLYDRIKPAASPEVVFANAVKALDDRCDYAYRRLKVTNRLFADNLNNVHNTQAGGNYYVEYKPL